MKESNRIELKIDLTDSLEKEVVAFLNYREGGHIYIGINDATCTVVGVPDSGAIQLKINSHVSEAEIYDDFAKIYRRYKALNRHKVGDYFFKEFDDLVDKLCDDFEKYLSE